jgi:hypothetical protein
MSAPEGLEYACQVHQHEFSYQSPDYLKTNEHCNEEELKAHLDCAGLLRVDPGGQQRKRKYPDSICPFDIAARRSNLVDLVQDGLADVLFLQMRF